jgi:hypothetical protein
VDLAYLEIIVEILKYSYWGFWTPFFNNELFQQHLPNMSYKYSIAVMFYTVKVLTCLTYHILRDVNASWVQTRDGNKLEL